MLRFLAALVAAALMTAPALAQENDDVIVVTGQLMQRDADQEAPFSVQSVGGGYSSPPYVSITVPADYVIFTVDLETGTRSVDERARELERAFTALAARINRAQGVILEVGYPGRSSPLETTAAREAIVDDGDRSSIPLVFKFSVQRNDTFPALRTRAEAFIAGLQLSGRVEAVTGDVQYAGVSDPKRHRETLLRRIADDTRLLQTIFAAPGGPPTTSITGLEGRVRTRPSGSLELEMYIPYAVVLGSPQPPR